MIVGFRRTESFLWIKTKACLDECRSWCYIRLWQQLHQTCVNGINISMSIWVKILHLFVTKPFFRKLIFENSTQCGNLLGRIPFCEEEGASCEEIESLQML